MSSAAGYLYDVSGSYSISFWVSGLLIATAGVICLPIRCINKLEIRHKQGSHPADVTDAPALSLTEVHVSGSQYSRLSTSGA